MAENPSGGNGGEDKFGFLVRKIGPLPVWAWGAIAVGLYYWYTHYGPGANSAGSNASGTSDNVTETLNTSTGPTSTKVTETGPTPPTPKPPHGKPTAKEPRPKPVRIVRKPVHTPPKKDTTVTVAKWPGKSSNGRAQWNTTLSGIAGHEHVSLPALEKANPQIKDPNLIYPGEKVNVP